MNVFRNLDQVPADFGPSVVTVGNFDGVHCGHRAILAELVSRARALNAKAVVITLDPHPATVLRAATAPRMITPLPAKLALLQQSGIDAVLLIPFDDVFAQTSALQFAERVLRDGIHAVEIHEGHDFRFGHRGEGNMALLQTLGTTCGFNTCITQPLTMGGSIVSSSRIRTLIAAGNVSAARRLLGRPFSVHSTPASGRGYGTRYAVPTINLAPYADLLPGHGVYITDLTIGEGDSAETFEGVTNIGNRPTFGVDSFAVETYLLRFHPVTLDESTPLTLTLYKRLREERKWPSPEALKAQIGLDVARAERWFHLRSVMASRAWSQV